MQIEFKSAYFEATVHYVSHYATGTTHNPNRFYGISTILGYLMPNQFYTYIYLPTPPLGQDMMQGLFLSGV